MHYFTSLLWIFNILLLFIFLIELKLRNLLNYKLNKLKHAHITVLLSMLTSIISSTSFLISQNMFLFDMISNKYINTICLYGPIIAISFRTISKTFIWALYIVRGQMVIISLDNKFLIKIAFIAPYLLIIQCLLVTVLIITLTETARLYLLNQFMFSNIPFMVINQQYINW